MFLYPTDAGFNRGDWRRSIKDNLLVGTQWRSKGRCISTTKAKNMALNHLLLVFFETLLLQS